MPLAGTVDSGVVVDVGRRAEARVVGRPGSAGGRSRANIATAIHAAAA